jgi:phage shock protein A
VSAGKKKVKEDEERLQNELRQLFIDKYRTGHFDSIKSVKKVIKECQKLLKEAENPREKKRLESLIKVTDKQLLNLRNRTPQVLKNSNRMQRQLDSLRERG